MINHILITVPVLLMCTNRISPKMRMWLRTHNSKKMPKFAIFLGNEEPKSITHVSWSDQVHCAPKSSKKRVLVNYYIINVVPAIQCIARVVQCTGLIAACLFCLFCATISLFLFCCKLHCTGRYFSLLHFYSLAVPFLSWVGRHWCSF